MTFSDIRMFHLHLCILLTFTTLCLLYDATLSTHICFSGLTIDGGIDRPLVGECAKNTLKGAGVLIMPI